MSSDPLLVLDSVFAGYGKMTILNGVSAAIRRDRSQRGRQVDHVQDDFRAAGGAQRGDQL